MSQLRARLRAAAHAHADGYVIADAVRLLHQRI
jgi:hypothetical protein